jgi:hypothetical protein
MRKSYLTVQNNGVTKQKSYLTEQQSYSTEQNNGMTKRKSSLTEQKSCLREGDVETGKEQLHEVRRKTGLRLLEC